MTKFLKEKPLVFCNREILNQSFSLLLDAHFSTILKESKVLISYKSLKINRVSCFLSLRRSSVLKGFRLSRSSFRVNAGFGKLPGVRRSVW